MENPQDNQSEHEHGFAPAPNPFEKATNQPHEDIPAPPPLHEGVELVGKRADEKPAAQSATEPKKKRSVFSLVFGGNQKPADNGQKKRNAQSTRASFINLAGTRIRTNP